MVEDVENIEQFWELTNELENIVKQASEMVDPDPYYVAAFRLVVGIRASFILMGAARKLELISQEQQAEAQHEMIKTLAVALKKLKEEK